MTQIMRSARNIVAADRSFRLPLPDVIAIWPRTRLDLQCCVLLLVLTAIMVLPGALSLPMELWDESRNANNAMELAKHGGWIAPTFDYVRDHWNTKPPLLIWIMAALLRTGLDPMLAVRLPSVAATMGSVLLVYFTCRTTIQDRLAGVLGGLLVICSVLFMGDHVGRTGDYDALLSFLSFGFILCVGRYLDNNSKRSGGWIGAGGVLLFLAIMTKGVAAGMALPGLLAYAIACRRLFGILRDWRVWASIAGVSACVAGWLALREQFDPGYLEAMWYNDVGGRLFNALEQHSEGPLFYLMVLAVAFQPAILALPTLLLVRRDRDPARRRLCLLMLLTAASWLIALSCAGTKIYWYTAPMVPLLAVAIATGATTFLRRNDPPLSSLIVIRPIIVAMLIAFWYLNVRAPSQASAYTADQVWYGSFLDNIRRQTGLNGAVIVDDGLPNDAGFPHYNPVARFFAEDAARRGEHIQVVTSKTPIAKNAKVITCDPRIRTWLKSQTSFTVIQSDRRCILGRVTTSPDKAMAPEG
jgi:4-amino-4-deoxy-L-arabinose transferase-like glycosyltransferase